MKQKIKNKVLIITLLTIITLFIIAFVVYVVSDDCPTEVCRDGDYYEGLFPWLSRHIKALIN